MCSRTVAVLPTSDLRKFGCCSSSVKEQRDIAENMTLSKWEESKGESKERSSPPLVGALYTDTKKKKKKKKSVHLQKFRNMKKWRDGSASAGLYTITMHSRQEPFDRQKNHSIFKRHKDHDLFPNLEKVPYFSWFFFFSFLETTSSLRLLKSITNQVWLLG